MSKVTREGAFLLWGSKLDQKGLWYGEGMEVIKGGVVEMA
jgi:hypothetical protein